MLSVYLLTEFCHITSLKFDYGPVCINILQMWCENLKELFNETGDMASS